MDLDHSGQIDSTADVQIEFGRETVRVFFTARLREWNYPPGYVIAFNRTDLEPLWGAWAMEILIMVGVAAVIGLPVELVVAGDRLFSAGLAARLFCEPRFEFPPKLAAGGRGVDAGGAVDGGGRSALRIGF